MVVLSCTLTTASDHNQYHLPFCFIYEELNTTPSELKKKNTYIVRGHPLQAHDHRRIRGVQKY